jgi:hypothetical protein
LTSGDIDAVRAGRAEHAGDEARLVRGVEGVGFEDVGAGIQVRLLDGGDDVRTAEQQQVVVTLDVARPVGKPFAAVVLFFQLIALDHRAHAAVEDQDAFLEGLVKGLADERYDRTWDYSVQALRRAWIIANLCGFGACAGFA